MYLENNKKSSITEFLLTFLVFGYLASSYVLISFSWGRYVMLAMVVTIFLLSAVFNNGKIELRFDSFAKWELLFVAFCWLSVLWARDMGHALSKSITLFEIGICTYLIDTSLPKEKRSDILLNALIFSGYAEVVFLLLTVGINQLAMVANENSRLATTIGNANFIGMVMAINIVVTLYDMLKNKFKIYHLIAVFSVVVLAVTQSRTALFGCVLGILMLLCFVVATKKITFKKYAFIVVFVLVIIVAFFSLRKTNLFGGMIERVTELFTNIKGGQGDSSSRVRLEMIGAGLKQFLKAPFWGIGIDNGFHVSLEAVGEDFYLHCNYVELLVGIGLVGFILYYWIFVKIFKNALKGDSFSSGLTKRKLAFVIICVILLMDVGTVSYYMKEIFYYILLSLSLISGKEVEK